MPFACLLHCPEGEDFSKTVGVISPATGFQLLMYTLHLLSIEGGLALPTGCAKSTLEEK